MDYEKLIYLVIGAFIGFITSLVKDLLIESKKNKIKNIELKRERLEELYIDFSKWSNYIYSDYITLLSVMDNKLTYNQYLDLKLERKNDFDAQKIDMIIEVYINSIIPTYTLLREKLESLNMIQNEYKKDYELYGQHDTKEVYKNGITAFLKDFTEVVDNLKKEIALEIRNSNY